MWEVAREMVRCRRKTKFKAGVKQKNSMVFGACPNLRFTPASTPGKRSEIHAFPAWKMRAKLKIAH